MIDLSVLIPGLLKHLLWVLPVFLLLAILKSPRVKGWFGEMLVSRKAASQLPASAYHAFNNVTIPDGEGTTQIDHIYVSRFGLFVVETKHLSGWIFGQEHQPQWTQRIYRKKTRFQNPIRQNFKHLKALENLLHVSPSMLHSVIVLTGNAEIKTSLPEYVCTLSNFTRYITSFTVPVLTESEVQDICAQIENERLTADQATHHAHVQHLRNTHRTSQKP